MRHLLFSLILLCISQTISAQATNFLGVGPSGIQAFSDSITTTPLDSVELNAQIYYKVQIINAGTDAITDTTTVDLLSITSLDSVPKVLGPPFVVNTSLQNPLVAGDSLTPSPVAIDTATADRYGTGGGGVVVIIWPSARHGIFGSKDTGSVTINTLTASLGNKWAHNQFKIRFGPNPTQQVLHIDYGSLSTEIEYVRIIDNYGKIILQHNQAATKLSLGSLPAGTYSLSIQARDGRHAVYRIVKY